MIALNVGFWVEPTCGILTDGNYFGVVWLSGDISVAQMGALIESGPRSQDPHC